MLKKTKGITVDIVPRVEMRATEERAELYLYGDVVSDAYLWDKEDEHISAKKVKEELDNLNGQDLLVHINSFGGMTFEGVAVYNLLMDYDGNVDVQIDGIAASAATIIAMAGRTIKGRANTMFMIHKGWTWTAGNAIELRKTADLLDKIDEAVDVTYMSRFTGTKEELTKLLDDETFMTAEEAVKYGFYDEIIEEEEKSKEEPKEEIKKEQPKSLFDIWKENKELKAAEKAVNLFAKFAEEK